MLASFNHEELPEITSWVSGNFPDVDFHSFELLRPPFPDSTIRPLTAPEYADALTFLKPYWERFQRYRPVLRHLKVAAREAELETLEAERMVYPCYAGTVSGVLNPEGTVSLCEVQWEVGNIRDFGYSFRKAWFSEKAQEMRRKIAQRACWCTHSCFMSSSLPFSVKGVARLAKTALLPQRPGGSRQGTRLSFTASWTEKEKGRRTGPSQETPAGCGGGSELHLLLVAHHELVLDTLHAIDRLGHHDGLVDLRLTVHVVARQPDHAVARIHVDLEPADHRIREQLGLDRRRDAGVIHHRPDRTIRLRVGRVAADRRVAFAAGRRSSPPAGYSPGIAADPPPTVMLSTTSATPSVPRAIATA